MIVYLAMGDCGDYYCDAEHPLGVYSTQEKARDRLQRYQKAMRHVGYGGVAPLEIDENNPNFPQGTHGE